MTDWKTGVALPAEIAEDIDKVVEKNSARATHLSPHNRLLLRLVQKRKSFGY